MVNKDEKKKNYTYQAKCGHLVWPSLY